MILFATCGYFVDCFDLIGYLLGWIDACLWFVRVMYLVVVLFC